VAGSQSRMERSSPWVVIDFPGGIWTIFGGSPPPVASIRPSGRYARLERPSPASASMIGSPPVRKFQTRAVRSAPTAASRCPLGLYATAIIGPGPPRSRRLTLPPASHATTAPSLSPAASSPPVGANAGPPNHRGDAANHPSACAASTRNDRMPGSESGSQSLIVASWLAEARSSPPGLNPTYRTGPECPG
jgi:hypothetical protein